MLTSEKIDLLLRALSDGSYYQELYANPAPHRDRTAPRVAFHQVFSDGPAIQTIVTPTFNHADMIELCIGTSFSAVTAPTDYIFIDDGSDDGTVERTIATAKTLVNPHTASIAVLSNPVPIYETACDNLGFWLAETPFIFEVQADIEINEPGFDRKFRDAATSTAPASVSGRGGHTFELLIARTDIQRGRPNAIGLCGAAIETPASVDNWTHTAFQCETVIRGPWLLLKADLQKYGYLDEKNFFLGNDDHDYNRRLFEAEGRRPLYLPTRINSPLARGPTRRKRTGKNLEVFEILNASKQGSEDFWRFVRTYLPIHYPVQIDITAGDNGRTA